MASGLRAITVGGIGAPPTIEDIVKIVQGVPVALDAAAAERIKKESPLPKTFASEEFKPTNHTGSSDLSADQVRAILVVRLLTIINGKTNVRPQIPEFIRDLLNHQITPNVSTREKDREILNQLANQFHASEDGLEMQKVPIKTLLESKGLDPPSLSASERLVLESGTSATAGIAALCTHKARKLLSAANAISALSFEATGAQIKSLDVDVVEAVAHKGSLAAADELRSLLDGSKQVNTAKNLQAEHLFSSLSTRLGAAADAVYIASNILRVEVQSSALAPRGSKVPLVATAQLGSSLVEVGRAFLVVAQDSMARSQVMMEQISMTDALQAQVQAVESALRTAREEMAVVAKTLIDSTNNKDDPPNVLAALATERAVSALHSAVSLEALMAVAALRVLEGPPQPEAPVAEVGQVGVEAVEATAEDGDKENKKGGRDRKKKEKGGGGKGGAGGALVLGNGSVLARAYFESAATGGSGILPCTAESALELNWSTALEALSAALDPLSSRLNKLLDELHAVIEANQARRKPKVAKGTRDFLPDQMALREAAFGTITSVFKRHGAVAIDTPVFELRETLMGKYGEDSKLIYDLADQGGEALSLRYDLTVPFARFVAVHSVGNIKRYHIGKVYRRDQPQMTRGRFREFFQCDFDVAGAYPVMVADAEVLKVLTEILEDLKLGQFEVKLNHRRLLDATLAIAGVPTKKFRAICSAIDKLDKEPWEEVRREMVEDKGLTGEVADKIGEFVVLRGEPFQLLEKLSAAEHPLAQNPDSHAALDELRLLFTYLQAMGALGSITFDLSLARGLDYYTGVIYEAVLVGANMGSIAAGGRYDKLVGMFSGKDVPAVGMSIGVERVFAIMEAQARERAAETGRKIRATETEVLVSSIGNNQQVRRMEVAAKLWAAGIKAEFGFKANPKMGDQLNYALEEAIPFMVLFGETEIEQNVVKVKDMEAKTEDTVPLDELVENLRQRLSAKKLLLDS